MKVIRIFPRKTNATPDDDLVRINEGPGLFDEADEIHISVSFTWDLAVAEKLEKEWQSVASVKIGGPATGEKSGEFIPGMYLKKGYVITSRGCNNRCWFCSVWKREGTVMELPIKDGYIVLDDNLLACSKSHINDVFFMLSQQKKRPLFTGGLEAKLLTPEIAEQLYLLKPVTIYFAYDTSDDLDPLINAGKLLFGAGFIKEHHILRAYVLIGYPDDNFDLAIKRLKQTWDAGFMPMAMLYRDDKGDYDIEWKRFQRQWANPVITAVNCKKLGE